MLLQHYIVHIAFADVCLCICEAKISSEHKCSRFCRIGTKFDINNDLLRSRMGPAGSTKSNLQNFKNGCYLNFQIFPIKTVYLNCRKIEPRFFEHKSSGFRRIGTKFGKDDDLGLEWVQKEAESFAFKIFKIAATLIFNFFPI